MYINTQTGEYPLSENDIRNSFPNVSFPTPFVPTLDFAWVFPSPKPDHNPLIQNVQETAPMLLNGKLYQQWSVVSKFVEYTDESNVVHTVAEQETAVLEADLAAKRALRNDQIRKIRDEKIQTGGYTTNGKWFHSDTFSRTQQLGLVMMGASMPAGIQWKTMDGSFIEMTPTLAGQIFAAAAAQDMEIFDYAETLIVQVNAAADPNSIDINTGWPSTYA